MARPEMAASQNPDVISAWGFLEYYLSLGPRLEKPPEVRLQIISQAPLGNPPVGAVDIAATSAFQCYSPGIAVMKPREDEKALATAAGTLKGGHHTTRLHTNYTFKLIGVTRSATHDFFHYTPFYNTTQQSQRYVEARAGNYQVPGNLPEQQRNLFVDSADFANQQYFVLLENLRPVVETRLRRMYPAGGEVAEKRLSEKAVKICQEVARYVLPIGQLTIYDHTLSELQLLRIFRASQMPHFTDEARYVIGQMIGQVAKVDPTILTELRKPLLPKNIVKDDMGIEERYLTEQADEFDSNLTGRLSKMEAPADVRTILVRAGRNILGMPSSQISDKEVLALMMDPKNNSWLADVYETGMFDPLTSCLREVSLTFETKLSHTADSQRQRHRRTPGSTPPITTLYRDGSADYVTPMVIREDSRLSELYRQMMSKIYDNVESAIEAGIPRQESLLLLPNAQTVRVTEQGDLFDWFHRWKQRLCLTAQEEIFFISLDQVEQVARVLPEAGEMLLAPCGLRQRAEIKPRCPEGSRWCGQPVYNLTINDYKESRLV